MSATREIVLKFDGETALQNMSDNGFIYTSYDWCVMLRVYIDIETANGSVIWGGNDDSGTPWTSIYVRTYNNKIRTDLYDGPNREPYISDYSISKSGIYNIAIRTENEGYTQVIVNGNIDDSITYNPYVNYVRTAIGANANYSGNGEFGAPNFELYSNQHIAEILQIGNGDDGNAMPTAEEIIEMQNSTNKYSEYSEFSSWNIQSFYCDFTKQNLETIENGGLSTGELTVREGQTFYTLIPLEPKTGQLIAKKQKTYDITDKDYIIDYNHFYGGDFSVECDNSEIVNYGFDFNGNTGIKAYKTETLSATNSSIYFELFYKYSDFHKYIYHNQVGYNNGEIKIYTIGFNLYVKFYKYESTLTSFLGTITPEEETKILIVYSNSDSKQKLNVFINGSSIFEQIGLYPYFSTYNIANLTKTQHIGFYDGAGANQYCISTLSNLTFYNEALTEAEAIAITSGGFDSTDNRIVFYESFNNETKGAITGTEQYAIIEQRPVEQQFTIGFWNEAQQAFTFAGKQTITGNIAEFSYDETATRRMKIGINGEQPLTQLTLTQEKLFDVLVDSNVVSSGATTQDRFVNYNQVLNNSRTLTVRVKNEDYNFAQTLFKNKVYLDNEEWQISSLNVERLGLSHRKFNMSLQRLL